MKSGCLKEYLTDNPSFGGASMEHYEEELAPEDGRSCQFKFIELRMDFDCSQEKKGEKRLSTCINVSVDISKTTVAA